jgi:hypothetical protein
VFAKSTLPVNGARVVTQKAVTPAVRRAPAGVEIS